MLLVIYTQSIWHWHLNSQTRSDHCHKNVRAEDNSPWDRQIKWNIRNKQRYKVGLSDLWKEYKSQEIKEALV